MRRPRTVVVAGAVTAFAATLGLGANLGLFGLAQPDSPVGRLDGARTVSVASAHAVVAARGTVAVHTAVLTTDGRLADD